MIDSHIHLSHKLYDQEFPYIIATDNTYKIEHGTRKNLIQTFKYSGINACIEPATDIASNELLLKLSRDYDGFIFPAVGNHPTRCIHSGFLDFRRLKEFSEDAKVVAIGETGLDFHLARKKQHRIRQKVWFSYQLNLAHKLELPLVLHIRDADTDAIRILRRNRKKLHGGVCHCYQGKTGSDVAKIYTQELGLCIGIGGSLLMKTEISKPLEECVISTPMDKILLETDGPYVKPLLPETICISKKKWEKARNTSLILQLVAQRIAELKGLTKEDVISISDKNICRLFNL